MEDCDILDPTSKRFIELRKMVVEAIALHSGKGLTDSQVKEGVIFYLRATGDFTITEAMVIGYIIATI